MRGLLRAGMTGLLLTILALPAAAQDRLAVVTSFAILGDMAARIGGNHVSVHTLVGPAGDLRGHQPTAADAKAVDEADLLVFNGLGVDEIWIRRLSVSVGYHGQVVAASRGVVEIRQEADATHASCPYAWHDLSLAGIYVDNIVAGLSIADPANAADYRANGGAYKAEIAALDQEVRTEIATVPAERRRVMTLHDDFGYFGRAYGLVFVTPAVETTGGALSADDLARIIGQAKADAVAAIFTETPADAPLVVRIAAGTGAKVGGRLYADALSPPGGPAATLLGMARYNADTIVRALGKP